jgi:hypothetical protein
MRSSSLGKRESGEMESHHQDANLTEADKARRLLSNLRSPITPDTPTVTNETWRQVGNEQVIIAYPATRILHYGSSVTGPERSLQPFGLVSSVVRHVKGSERSLSQPIIAMRATPEPVISPYGVGWQIANVIIGAEWP